MLPVRIGKNAALTDSAMQYLVPRQTELLVIRSAQSRRASKRPALRGFPVDPREQRPIRLAARDNRNSHPLLGIASLEVGDQSLHRPATTPGASLRVASGSYQIGSRSLARGPAHQQHPRVLLEARRTIRPPVCSHATGQLVRTLFGEGDSPSASRRGYQHSHARRITPSRTYLLPRSLATASIATSSRGIT